MTKCPEWTAYLLVDEAMGTIERGDPTRHGETDAEVSCPPRHRLAEPDPTAHDPRDGKLTRATHRFEVFVDAEGRVEQILDACARTGRHREAAGHGSILADVVRG
jgi:hypothetical protein